MAKSWPNPPPLFDVGPDSRGARRSWFDIPDEPLAVLGVFDLETTGVDVANDRIVTAYVGLLDRDGDIVHAQHWLADPGVEIPASAEAVHGISTEHARRSGEPASNVVTAVTDSLRAIFDSGLPVVAYNAPFDFSLLRAECIRHGADPLDTPAPVLDPLVIDKNVDRYRKGGRTLSTVAKHYRVHLDAAHDASADAVAAGRVALALLDRFGDHLADDPATLHTQQIGWAREQADSLTEYFIRIGRLDPSERLDGGWPVRTELQRADAP